MRQELNVKHYKRIESFDVVDSSKDNLIQLADIIVGALNRSLHSENTDSQDYVRVIKKKIVEMKPLDLLEKT